MSPMSLWRRSPAALALAITLPLAACGGSAVPEASSSLGRTAASEAGDAGQRVSIPRRFLPGQPFLVRVDALRPDGQVNRDLWQATASLSVEGGGVQLDPAEITLFNGRGSALITTDAEAAFTLTLTLEGAAASYQLTPFAPGSATVAGGTLPAGETRWEGVVDVTSDVTVPEGATLTIAPGALVRVGGTAEDGVDILVNGILNAAGEEGDPITIGALDPDLGWGELRVDGSAGSTVAWTHISHGGRADPIGHTHSGPALRILSSTFSLEHSVVADLVGKVMWADISDVTMADLHLARANMGPELRACPMQLDDVWITEMYGPDDNDGMYIRDHETGQRAILNRLTIADGDDDALDVHFATVDITDSIFRDFFDKGISIDAGDVVADRILITGCARGIHNKNPSSTILTRSTVALNSEKGLWTDYNPEHRVKLFVDAADSIIWGNGDDIVFTRSADDMILRYSDIGEPWPGEGNLQVDPQFVEPDAGDLRLRPGSPCLDAGDPASELDVDGSRADLGFYPTDDGDGDGFTDAQGDCADDDPAVYPGAPELLDGADQDCDLEVDEGAPTPAPPTPTPGPTPTEMTAPPTSPTPPGTPGGPTPTEGAVTPTEGDATPSAPAGTTPPPETEPPTDAPTTAPAGPTPAPSPTGSATTPPGTPTPGDGSDSCGGCASSAGDARLDGLATLLLLIAPLARRRRGARRP